MTSRAFKAAGEDDAPSSVPEAGPAPDRMTGPVRGPARVGLVLLLGSLVAIGPLTSDMYLPAFPAMGRELGASASGIQLTLAGALIGLALGQLLVGPLSDAVGRRRPLLAGIGVHVLASLACAWAPNLAVLDVLRVIQGLGCATSTVITMAIVRDLYQGDEAAVVLSRLMLVLGISPILAPTLGGVVLTQTSWRGIFVVLAVASVAIAAITAAVLPETLPAQNRRRGGAGGTLRDFRQLLHDRVFIAYILVAGLAMCAIFGFVAGSPYVFQDRFQMSEQTFGYVFGAGSICVVIGTQLNALLLRTRSPQHILRRALTMAAGFSVLLLAAGVSGQGGLWAVLLPLWGTLTATGFVMPNAPALALSRHGQFAGTAAALLGAVQFGVGAVAAPLVGMIGTGTTAMATVIAGGLILAVTVLLTTESRTATPAEQP
ncbi:multidrug effflux MFS transporter [Streptomyces parvulus]|uniref:multidrug effflux MFS transporter n=1 Tax=Streptomyces parvulus TaxID=146923 RepID=UPI0033C3172C